MQHTSFSISEYINKSLSCNRGGAQRYRQHPGHHRPMRHLFPGHHPPATLLPTAPLVCTPCNSRKREMDLTPDTCERCMRIGRSEEMLCCRYCFRWVCFEDQTEQNGWRTTCFDCAPSAGMCANCGTGLAYSAAPHSNEFWCKAMCTGADQRAWHREQQRLSGKPGLRQ